MTGTLLTAPQLDNWWHDTKAVAKCAICRSREIPWVRCRNREGELVMAQIPTSFNISDVDVKPLAKHVCWHGWEKLECCR
jgi:hypothetical protein